MEKTIKINIAGVIFQINENAFETLRDYLQSISSRLKNVAGGNEMIEDIEARIAEIFQSSSSWKTGVISLEDVEEMISTMGSPEEITEDFDTDYHYERKNSGKRMYRNPDGAIIGGVCSGLGAYFRIDPVILRVLFVVFSIFYLAGLFVYIVLWIALPGAVTPSQKKELHKDPPRRRDVGQTVNREIKNASENISKAATSENSRKVGNAFNEIFRAFGKFFVILFRIIIAIIGVSFIVTGFSMLFSFIVIAFFNTTPVFGNIFDTEIFYLPDFLSFIVNPSVTPWLMILSSLVIILPLFGIIYWGIRMVFQFRVRDLILNLTMFIIWIVSCTALSLLLFSEGISFSNSGRTTEEISLPASDTIIIGVNNYINSIEYERAIHLPFGDGFALYLDEDNRKIFGGAVADIYRSDEEEPYMQIVKHSNGRTRSDALTKADNLNYLFNITDNSLFLDEYFTIPEGNRWSGAYIKIKIYIPEGVSIFVEEDAEDIFDDYLGNGIYSYELGDKTWIMTNEGLERNR